MGAVALVFLAIIELFQAKHGPSLVGFITMATVFAWGCMQLARAYDPKWGKPRKVIEPREATDEERESSERDRTKKIIVIFFFLALFEFDALRNDSKLSVYYLFAWSGTLAILGYTFILAGKALARGFAYLDNERKRLWRWYNTPKSED